MRNLAILGCVTAVVACGGGGNAKQDSAALDTTTVVGPPAVPVSAAPARGESIAPRPAGTKTSGTRTGGTTPGTSTPTVGPDSVRGIVAVVGTSLEKMVMVAPPGGGRRIEITGPIATLVGRASGADVLVTGTPSGTTLEATRFVVRTVDGAQAIDGTLKTEGGSLYIVTANGTRTRIATPPPPLVGHDGARVWITGDPSRGVASFGFIDPPG